MRERDPRKKKLRDLRRAGRNDFCRPRLYRLFDRLHPEYDHITDFRKWRYRLLYPGEWERYYNAQRAWVRSIIGPGYYGSPPSHYRRDSNRLRRHRQKQALRRAIENDTLEDFSMPRERKDVGWDYW